MGLRSGDCGGHSIILSRRRLKRCSRNSLQSLDVCLGSLSCWKMNPRPIRCFPEGMAWSSKMVLYACLSIIPDTWTKSPTLLFPKYPHIIIEPLRVSQRQQDTSPSDSRRGVAERKPFAWSQIQGTSIRQTTAPFSTVEWTSFYDPVPTSTVFSC